MELHQTDAISDMAIKAAPPIAVSSLTLFGIDVPGWIQIFTLVYVLFMAINQIWSFAIKLKAQIESKE